MPHADPEKRKEYMRQWIIKNRARKRAHGKKWYAENRDKVIQRSTAYYAEHKDEILERERLLYQTKHKFTIKQRRANMVAEAMAAYGNKCACCGESNRAFLSLDHVNSDGARERKVKGYTNAGFYRKLKREGWPDYIRLLCFNCNLGRQFRSDDKTCPHTHVNVRGLLLLQAECFQ